MIDVVVNGYKLDENQLASILDNKKYSLIIAGAGSGKSLTLVGKIKYLLENKILTESEICPISFTNESAKSLERNIIKNCGVNISTFTFHKLALNIIKSENVNYKISQVDLLDFIIDEFFQSVCFGNIFLRNIILNKFKFYFFKSDKLYFKVIDSKEFVVFKKTISTFINLFKSNGFNKNDFLKFFEVKKFKNTLIIIYAIYLIYENEKESTNSLDFDDMMILSKNLINKNGCKFPFKLLIIDEFQDTSLCRFDLIREIVKCNEASLCVVGDDYQSIYRFSGCDIYLFLHFKDYYKDAKIYMLNNTYRNSQELINVSGKFIQKNNNQVKKDLVSFKRLSKPVIIVYFKDFNNILEKVINLIEIDKEILIISRNSFDLKRYVNYLNCLDLGDGYLKFEKFQNRKIRFLTIHKSKGLESDIVIFLNLENSLYGMPSQIKDEEIFTLIKKNDSYPYEEERRLFYVGLTRTKEYVFLLTPLNKPSIFINEIKKDNNVKCLYL
jgi:DNA helicase-4